MTHYNSGLPGVAFTAQSSAVLGRRKRDKVDALLKHLDEQLFAIQLLRSISEETSRTSTNTAMTVLIEAVASEIAELIGER